MPARRVPPRRRARLRSWRLTIVAGLAIAVLTAGLSVFALSTEDDTAPTAALTSEDAGQRAPRVQLATLDGTFDLAEHKGKVVVLFFTFIG